MKNHLRVWHVPQECKHVFYVDVDSVQEALKVLHILARYETFQYDNWQKDDFSCKQGLQIWDNNLEEWVEWKQDDMDIHEYEFSMNTGKDD